MNDEAKDKQKRKAPLPTPPQMEERHLERGEKKVVYFTREMWKGVKEVLKCACGEFRDTRDEMIEHVLLHFPKSEQESILEKLLKE